MKKELEEKLKITKKQYQLAIDLMHSLKENANENPEGIIYSAERNWFFWKHMHQAALRILELMDAVGADEEKTTEQPEYTDVDIYQLIGKLIMKCALEGAQEISGKLDGIDENVLENIAGITVQPGLIENEIEVIYRLIAREKISEAREKISSLRSRIEDTGELVRAETLIRRLQTIAK